MKHSALVLSVVIASVIITAAGADWSSSFLINCGSDSNVTVDGRRWTGDMLPADATNVTLTSVGFPANTSAYRGDSALAPLYSTARVFTASSNYTVKLAKADYFLRLHFYPFVVGSYSPNQSEFGVVANGLNLLSEFNVSDSILRKTSKSGNSSSDAYLVKEYYLGVDSDVLVIDFIPSKGSFGFVNAIEIIMVTSSLFKDSVPKVGGKGESNFVERSRRGMETMYRLDVGGSAIKPGMDSDLRRSWELDISYMVTANAGIAISNNTAVTYASDTDTSVAPLLVYQTARTMSNTEVLEKRFNMSWKFEVDPDFEYLIRMHFCELESTKANQRDFRIYINNRTAADNFDIFERAGGANIAYHQDYLDEVSSQINDLYIQLGPETTTGAAETDAILNGLEIFKISGHGNLAYLRKFPQTGHSTLSSSMKLKLWVGIGVGIASVAVLGAVASVFFCLHTRRREKAEGTKKRSPRWKPFSHHGSNVNMVAYARESTGTQNHNGSMTTNRTGKRFTLAEIRAATNNFDESLVIGVGGFGKVYKGEIEDGTLAAIKRAHPESQQGAAEFETEIEMLSKLRHRHLVCMTGFCEEQNEMILVYEYMANGTLRSHLFGSDLPPLTWRQRIEACIGAARGLHYLHTGADRGVIHRDVKTTNILLDENFVAKMADFGLSKTGPSLDHTHVSTAVKGSFGYLDPEYFRRQQLTEKSDVYSFGVVLFEVVCARTVINPSLPRDQINLAEWALRWQRERSLESIIDPHLKDSYSAESMIKFGEVAEKCLADEGRNRPTMGEVLWHLEYVLQLQDAWLRSNNTSDNSFSGIKEDKQSAGSIDGDARTDPKKSDEPSSSGSKC
uniref:non-specific serine/threonine protein kinase n=1 Tax=Kalanchoe fedtschenkoi TaxID=63787 RepID=A0A7N0U8T6_KALFE